MIDHTRIDHQAESAKQYITQLAKARIETSNRSFGQLNRYTRDRFDLARVESENMGDDAVGCSGLRWGDS